MLLDEVAEVAHGGVPSGTLVLDTADWAERLCIDATCARFKVKGIEDFGYGKGYTYAKEEFAPPAGRARGGARGRQARRRHGARPDHPGSSSPTPSAVTTAGR